MNGTCQTKGWRIWNNFQLQRQNLSPNDNPHTHLKHVLMMISLKLMTFNHMTRCCKRQKNRLTCYWMYVIFWRPMIGLATQFSVDKRRCNWYGFGWNRTTLRVLVQLHHWLPYWITMIYENSQQLCWPNWLMSMRTTNQQHGGSFNWCMQMAWGKVNMEMACNPIFPYIFHMHLHLSSK